MTGSADDRTVERAASIRITTALNEAHRLVSDEAVNGVLPPTLVTVLDHLDDALLALLADRARARRQQGS